MEEKTKGKIEYLAKNGFGFINIEGREKDVFFHNKEVTNKSFSDLNVGDEVSIGYFEDSEKGQIAKDIEVK